MIVGITSGCFDLLHPTHIEYLNKCAALCDALHILLDSDYLTNVRKNKYPIFGENDRKYMLMNISCVTDVEIFNSLENYPLLIHQIIGFYRPIEPEKTIIFKHSNTIDSKDLILVPGTETIVIPDVIRFSSTTQIINHLKTLS